MSEAIRVVGLRDLTRTLKKLGDEGHWADELKALHVRIANAIIDEARSLAARSGRLQMVRAAEDLVASKTLNKVGVRMGTGASREWGLGAQFGSKTEGGKRRYPQFPEAKPAGYTVYPARSNMRAEILDWYGREVEALMDRATK